MNFVILSTLADIVGMPTEVVADFSWLSLISVIKLMIDKCSPLMKCSEMETATASLSVEINNYVYWSSSQYYLWNIQISLQKRRS